MRILKDAKHPGTLALCLILSASQALGQQSAEERLPADRQDFTLLGVFDDRGNPNQAEAREAQRGGDRFTPGEPEFTLLGTARIGDRYSAILKHRDGAEIVVVSDFGQEISIDGFEFYSLLEVRARQIDIQYPDSVNCVEFQSLGVSCETAYIATLELTLGDPLPRAMPISRMGSDTDSGSLTSDLEDSANPFETLREGTQQRSNGGQRATPSSAPSPRLTTIDPADVPPGMTIISTSTGDQLVPED